MTKDTNAERPLYLDPDRPVEERVNDLVSRMSREEKVSQMVHSAPAVERLGIPAYNWWNECLHGVGRAGIATVFPQAIGMAASWDVDLMHRTAVAISDEARAKHHDAIQEDGSTDWYYGLTFWTPNINIFRDPRWGRGQETYGEDPYLTAQMAIAFIKGLQGNDPTYFKVIATAKHYAVHSGPEAKRHHFNAVVNDRDLWNTYLPAFEATVKEAGVYSVMGAYNRTNGEACCASPTLLGKILRDTWGFEGYVVSDCGAIRDIYAHHQVVDSPEAAAAMAVANGCELNCGEVYKSLMIALEKGLIDEATIDTAVKRLFTARFRLGMFDPPERVPWAQIPIAVNDSAEHRALALKMAQESIVLLKNAGNLLPLGKNLKKIAVVGPNADDPIVLLGNYNGFPSSSVTPLAGIQAKAGAGTEVAYAKGCEIRSDDTSGFDLAVAAAAGADVVIAVMGLSQLMEGEEGQQEGVAGDQRSTGDRTELDLPGVQEDLLKALAETGKPLVVVLLNGSAVAVNWAEAHAAAIVEAWYPGEEGGTALADVLFGDYNPAGRLPVTFYKSADDLPPFRDYNMEGHTYRYFRGEPLYPFGYGLSYTTFAYSAAALRTTTLMPGDMLDVTVMVENTGAVAGDEVVQCYLKDQVASVPVPMQRLVGFERIHLEPGAVKQVTFTLTPKDICLVLDDGTRAIEPGDFELYVGGGQPATGAAGTFATFSVEGDETWELPEG
ncbi:MAG: glycoside hydrolase family 3 C-terminal domain-containing protein [Anaerolineae bacterium]|nr:glycoside hydrolase family 3 C-terminal domain-containing protein [Anaerolineae bacterium]